MAFESRALDHQEFESSAKRTRKCECKHSQPCCLSSFSLRIICLAQTVGGITVSNVHTNLKVNVGDNDYRPLISWVQANYCRSLGAISSAGRDLTIFLAKTSDWETKSAVRQGTWGCRRAKYTRCDISPSYKMEKLNQGVIAWGLHPSEYDVVLYFGLDIYSSEFGNSTSIQSH
jgi:hypothetical protein